MINNFIITLPAKIEKILEKINLNKNGLVFIVDKNKKLIGSVSDGDIRRSILSGYDIKKTILDKSKIVNTKPFFLNYKTDIKTILYHLQNKRNNIKYKCIPLVDNNRIIKVVLFLQGPSLAN